jgi:predicted glycosyltransferase
MNPQQILIVVYSHDTYGLGNMRRMLAITQELIDENGGVSVLMLSGSPMIHSFRLVSGMDYVKLPSLSRDESGRYGSYSLDCDYT